MKYILPKNEVMQYACDARIEMQLFY